MHGMTIFLVTHVIFKDLPAAGLPTKINYRYVAAPIHTVPYLLALFLLAG